MLQFSSSCVKPQGTRIQALIQLEVSLPPHETSGRPNVTNLSKLRKNSFILHSWLVPTWTRQRTTSRPCRNFAVGGPSDFQAMDNYLRSINPVVGVASDSDKGSLEGKGVAGRGVSDIHRYTSASESSQASTSSAMNEELMLLERSAGMLQVKAGAATKIDGWLELLRARSRRYWHLNLRPGVSTSLEAWWTVTVPETNALDTKTGRGSHSAALRQIGTATDRVETNWEIPLTSGNDNCIFIGTCDNHEQTVSGRAAISD